MTDKQSKKTTQKNRSQNNGEDTLQIIPLGGMSEIGRNMSLLEYKGEILVLDAGFGFPEEDTPGIDYTIPDITYLEEAKQKKGKRIAGILLTHGHYDHIGALPYILPKLGYDIPIYASELTAGIVRRRQQDFPDQPELPIKIIKDGDTLSLGTYKAEAFRLNHNVPGNLGFMVDTPVGRIAHVPDFKFDEHPVNDEPTDFDKLKRFGEKGVHLLMMDSTGAEEEGHSLSEQEIYGNLAKIFDREHDRRIFAATFASLLNRVQQLVTLSEKHGRKVAVEGYSMRSNVELARELGYLKCKKGTLIDSKQARKLPDNEVTVICTGAQGEGRAALMRIANGEHKNFQLSKNDAVIFSSSVVPGNERAVQSLKDQLYRQQADVYHYRMMDIHAGGHGQREELSHMLEMLNPEFFLPMHGQYSMLVEHSKLAQEHGISPEKTRVLENGQILNVGKNKLSVPKGEVSASVVMVDGLGIGDVGNVVLRDRQALAEDGMFVIVAVLDKKKGKVKGNPDIISRGFVYLNESQDLLKEAREKTASIINQAATGGSPNWAYVKDEVRNKIGDFLYSKTRRRPMVLPVIIDV